MGQDFLGLWLPFSGGFWASHFAGVFGLMLGYWWLIWFWGLSVLSCHLMEGVDEGSGRGSLGCLGAWSLECDGLFGCFEGVTFL